MTLRQEKLNTLFKKLIAEFLRLHPMPMSELVTVTECAVSRDVKSACVFISIYPNGTEEKVLRALRDIQKELLNFLKKSTRMKTIPHVRFIADSREQQREKISKLLNSQ